MKKAFTLVELIVVIAILAILGAIAFVSLQGYTKQARDSKRISDTRGLLTKVNIELIKGSLKISELIDDTTTATGQILGEKDAIFYTMGKANFENLKENPDNFKDPSTGTDYPLAYAKGGSGTGSYTFFEGATINEVQNITKIIIGKYYTIDKDDLPSLFVSGSVNYVDGGAPIYNVNPPTDTDISGGEVGEDTGGGDGGEDTGGGDGGEDIPILPSCDDETKPTNNGNILYFEGTPIIENQTRTEGAENCGYICKENYSGADCAIYTPVGEIKIEGGGTDGSFTRQDIVFSYSGTTYTIMDRNLGASEVYNGTEGSAARGDHYQWGRNNTDFTKSNSTGYSWTAKAQGPCPAGYHVPSSVEWDGLIKAWISYKGNSCTAAAGLTCSLYGEASGENIKNDLKLPFAGYRQWFDGVVYKQGTNGFYWSSTPTGNKAYLLYFYASNNVYPQYSTPSETYNRSYGYSIRCFKN